VSVASLCLTISSDRSWPRRPKLRRRRLGERVASVFEASRGTYGCRRVAAALNRQGTACSVGMVADLMHELGLKARQPRAYKVTTIDGGQAWRRPDLIEQDFTADRRVSASSATSPTCGPGRAGSSWPPSSTQAPAR